MRFSLLLLIVLLSTAHVDSWSLHVINQVHACPGRHYCTLKLFTANWQQKDLCRGTSSVLVERDEQYALLPCSKARVGRSTVLKFRPPGWGFKRMECTAEVVEMKAAVSTRTTQACNSLSIRETVMTTNWTILSTVEDIRPMRRISYTSAWVDDGPIARLLWRERVTHLAAIIHANPFFLYFAHSFSQVKEDTVIKEFT